MVKRITTIAIPLLLITGTSFASDHLTPDITDFDNPYVGYRSAYSAQILSIKGKKSAGSKPVSLRTELNQVLVGLKKERVDNRYSLIGFSYAQSNSGELDYTNSEIIVQNHYSFRYGEGRHIGKTGNIDWNIHIAIEAGDYQLGFDTKSDIGLGLGAELMYSLTSWLDIGAQLSISNQIQSLSLGGDINF